MNKDTNIVIQILKTLGLAIVMTPLIAIVLTFISLFFLDIQFKLILVISFILAAAFSVWWYSDGKNVQSQEEAEPQTPPIPEPEESESILPEHTVEKEEAASAAPICAAPLTEAPTKPVEPPKPAVIRMRCYPSQKDGHPLQYAYRMRFTAVDGVDVMTDILGREEKEVSVTSKAERIVLSFNGTVFGYIDNPDKALMLADWERRDFPCSAILLASGNEVNLRFYRDKRVGNEHRAQTVCKLVGCSKAFDKQNLISCIDIGAEIELKEDHKHDDTVVAYYLDESIGKLPKKYAVQFLNEGAYGAFCEKVEQDENFNWVPYIRIYWYKTDVPNSDTTASLVRRSTISHVDERTIAKLNRYAVVDVETTGLKPGKDRIIEVGIVVVDNGEVSTFSSYVNPEIAIPETVTQLTGIRYGDVANAPTYEQIAPIIYEKLNGLPLIAHNAGFDIGFLEAFFKEALMSVDLKSLDTLSLARRNIKGLSNYKLGTLAEYFGIDLTNAHRAGDDAYATMQVFEAIKKLIADRIAQEDAEKKAEKARLKAERLAKYSSSPLFDVNIVFTGEFDTDRNVLESRVADVGANLRAEVNTKTKYLVVGKTDNLPDWARERKLGKAEKLIADGKKITLISESEYLELIRQAKAALSNN